jgi:hypothetical protein
MDVFALKRVYQRNNYRFVLKLINVLGKNSSRLKHILFLMKFFSKQGVNKHMFKIK